MRLLLTLALLAVFWLPAVAADPVPEDKLDLILLRPGVYLHRTYMNDDVFGRFNCNGLVYVVGDEALVVDTPPDEKLSERLVKQVAEELGARVTGVVIGHTHADSMGGLGYFQKANITSYSSRECQRLTREKGLPVPQTGFEEELELTVGGKKVRCAYLGPGHSPDNAVTYLVEPKVLFGGCLIKALGAGRGYLGEASPAAWSSTVERVRQTFPDTEIVIPGHDKVGGQDLLQFTIDMFASDRK